MPLDITQQKNSLSHANFDHQDESIKLQAMANMLIAFNQINKEDDKVDKLKQLLLQNVIMQESLNDMRRAKGKTEIEFN